MPATGLRSCEGCNDCCRRASASHVLQRPLLRTWRMVAGNPLQWQGALRPAAFTRPETVYRTTADCCFAVSAANVDHARELLGTELAALVGESYERAYGDMVRVQQLTELEEVIRYSQLHADCAPLNLLPLIDDIPIVHPLNLKPVQQLTELEEVSS